MLVQKEKYEFPQSLPYHKNDDFILKDANQEGYAFYETKEGWGFKQGLEIAIAYRNKAEMESNIKPIVEVKSLSGNTWGKGSWLIIRSDYYLNMHEALAALKGETKVYPPKRKPEPIREMTDQEVRQYWELPEPKEED